MTKRVAKHKHRGMTKKLLHQKRPMSFEQKKERKRIRESSKLAQEEINKKAKAK